ncbi:MAG: hypothetical protein HWN81_11295 [Candidatus Lokiarchaeota archaeon]|nr:hypothetical protein [Candidatus Lokiarchaeota archaeon]
MRKHEKPKKQIKKEEILGSETILEKIKKKTPWIFGNWLRKPKIAFPKIKRKRLSLPIPPKSLIIIGIYVILFILQTGVIYLIVRRPPELGADEDNNPVFIYKDDIHNAYIIESIIASILMILFSTGFIILYHSSKYVYDKKFADWILVIGILLILIAFGLLQQMLRAKIPKRIGLT